MNGQVECPEHMADLFEVVPCKLGQKATDETRKKVDEKILCGLFCCCLDTGGNQGCVEEALTAADAETGYQARYKAEVSYNMQIDPPRPMMEKDGKGNLTTEPISRGNVSHLANRAKREYDPKVPEELRRTEGIGGYRWRRPDVVVVKDPSRPPHKTNISQVIEMKFPNDRLSPDQRADYERIGGKGKLKVYRKDEPCRCGTGKRPEPEPSTAPARAPRQVDQPAEQPGPTAVDWAILAGLGLTTIGLALLPFDGPAGEIAAGSATATQWALMFAPAS
ncbi:MAG: VRR-NUC domain-containing protein [Candidatus Thiosymbion ectosymbiont of Robbea hypermnestra]|nr:VRR-NUC domain-containing protein [Candidatus Thiosymbion ectosymbiont of Robbea hypermnestra]